MTQDLTQDHTTPQAIAAVIRRDDADSFVHTGRSSDAADDVATARTRLDAHRYAQVSSPVWVPYRRA